MKIVDRRPSAYKGIVRIEFDQLKILKDVKDILKNPEFEKLLKDKLLVADMLNDTEMQVKAMTTSPQELVYCMDTRCSVVLMNTKYESVCYSIFELATGKSIDVLLKDYHKK